MKSPTVPLMRWAKVLNSLFIVFIYGGAVLLFTGVIIFLKWHDPQSLQLIGVGAGLMVCSLPLRFISLVAGALSAACAAAEIKIEENLTI